jgi:hypothetical protein
MNEKTLDGTLIHVPDRTWLDNCTDKIDSLRAEMKKAYDHAELDATGYARAQARIDWLDAYVTMRNEINKEVILRAGSRNKQGWRE